MKHWKLLLIVAGFLCSAGIGVYAGYRIFRPAPVVEPKITAQVILTALRDRGFLVTQTYVFDEPVTIDKGSGNAFKDFFFGQKITARGSMEANLGIDLAKVTADDVKIEGNTVNVTIPQASIFNVRLVGPLDVQNDQGILKRLLQSDDGYNEAQAALSKAADDAAKQPDMLKRASDKAVDEVTRLLGYVAQGKTVTVTVK